VAVVAFLLCASRPPKKGGGLFCFVSACVILCTALRCSRRHCRQTRYCRPDQRSSPGLRSKLFDGPLGHCCKIRSRSSSQGSERNGGIAPYISETLAMARGADDDGVHRYLRPSAANRSSNCCPPRTSARPISFPRELKLHIEFPAARTVSLHSV